MAEDDKTPKPPMRRSLRILLIVSLALNLMVAGVIVGGIAKGRAPGPFGGFDMTLGPFARALDDDHRRELRDHLRGQEGLRPPSRRDRAEAMRDFMAALRADPFDPAAVDAIFAGQRDRATAGMRAGQDALLAQLQAMTAAERAAFADRLDHELREMQGDGRDRD